MLKAREYPLEFLVLAPFGVDLLYAGKCKPRLLHTRPCIVAGSENLLEGGPGLGGRLPGLPIGHHRGFDRIDGPRIEQTQMVCRYEELLVVVLAAQVDGGADQLRKLAHRRHRAVDGTTGTPFGRHAPLCDVPVGKFPRIGREKEPPFDRKPLGTVANLVSRSTIADQELYGRQQRRLARTGLAGQHRQARAGLDRRVGNQGNVGHMQFIDHGKLPLGRNAGPRQALADLSIEYPRHRRKEAFGGIRQQDHVICAAHHPQPRGDQIAEQRLPVGKHHAVGGTVVGHGKLHDV